MLFDNRLFHEYSQLQRSIVIYILTNIFVELCSCSFDRFYDFHNLMTSCLNDVKNDKILCFANNTQDINHDIIDILKFIIESVTYNDKIFYTYDMKTLGRFFCNIKGKIITLINDQYCEYDHSELANHKIRFHNLVTSSNYKNNAIIVSNIDMFKKYDKRLFTAYDLSKCVLNKNIGKWLQFDDINYAFRAYFKNQSRIKCNIQEHMFNDSIYESFNKFLDKTGLLKNDMTFDYYYYIFTKYCPTISNLNIETLIISFRKCLKTIRRRFKIKINDDSIEITNVILLKRNMTSHKIPTIACFIVDMFLLKRNGIMMKLKQFYQQYMTYVKIVFRTDITIKVRSFRKKLNELFEYDIVIRHNGRYRIEIEFTNLKKICYNNTWLLDLDVYEPRNK